jgi:hypothetical protein
VRSAEETMRLALSLFEKDPPDTDFQEGYLCGLIVFANEGLGFAWNDPDLIKCQPHLQNMGEKAEPLRDRLRMIEGGLSRQEASASGYPDDR